MRLSARLQSAQHWLISSISSIRRATRPTRVDATYVYELSGGWPFGERTGGPGIEDYEVVGDGPSYGMGLAMRPARAPPSPTSAGLTRKTSRSATVAALVLTKAVPDRDRWDSVVHGGRAADRCRGHAEDRARGQAPRLRLESAVHGQRPAGASPPPAGSHAPAATPCALAGASGRRGDPDATAVLPETARQAGVGGVVILPSDRHRRAVKDAKVAIAFPLLDQSGLDAARVALRVTQLVGMPVPVITTCRLSSNYNHLRTDPPGRGPFRPHRLPAGGPGRGLRARDTPRCTCVKVLPRASRTSPLERQRERVVARHLICALRRRRPTAVRIC